MPLISIISPVYNEEANIDRFYKAVSDVISLLEPEYQFEIIFTDNDSTDTTRARIVALMEQDPRVRYIKLSRNFGYQRSIWTGYTLATGDAAIELDCDLEDDPNYIPSMLRHWEEGAKIVYGIRIKRSEPRWLEHSRKLFYRLIQVISEDHLPPDAGDFMLIDRVILELVKQNRDPRLYLRGFIFSLGFRRVGFEYVRNSREGGVTKFNFTRLVGLAVDGIIRHSTMPLRMSSWIGMAAAAILMLLALVYATGRLFFELDWPPGFATVVVLQLLTFSLLALSVGILGEYVLRIYRLLNNEPMSIIEYEISQSLMHSDKVDALKSSSKRKQEQIS